MTILRKLLRSGDGHAARGWHRFGHGDQAVRYTEAWEHENFAEEQARWERSDPEYARICEQVRQARERGGKVHCAPMKPRPNGTLAFTRSVRRTMMPRERTML